MLKKRRITVTLLILLMGVLVFAAACGDSECEDCPPIEVTREVVVTAVVTQEVTRIVEVTSEVTLTPAKNSWQIVVIKRDGSLLTDEDDFAVLCRANDTFFERDDVFDPFVEGELEIPNVCDTVQVFNTVPVPVGRDNLSIVESVQLASSDMPQTVLLQPHVLLFRPKISLAWSPTEDYLNDLEAGFRAASRYLAQVTQGQALFGGIEVYSNGVNWDSADVQILAVNDQRPAASVGGIHSATDVEGQPQEPFIYYTETDYDGEKQLVDIIFSQGSIILPRAWNGKSPESGSWAQDAGFKTIAHEMSHYGLFMYDEYFDVKGTISSILNYCFQGKSSVASYHYGAEAFWKPNEIDQSLTLQNECQRSPQWVVHQEPDWETLTNWASFMPQAEFNFELADKFLSETTINTFYDFDTSEVSFGTTQMEQFHREGLYNILDGPRSEGSSNLLLQLYLDEFNPDNNSLHPNNVIAQGSKWITTTHVDAFEILGVQNNQQQNLHIEAMLYTKNKTNRFVLQKDTLGMWRATDVPELTWDDNYQLVSPQQMLATWTMTLSESNDPSCEDDLACSPKIFICQPHTQCKPLGTMKPVGTNVWTIQFDWNAEPPALLQFPNYLIRRVVWPNENIYEEWNRNLGGVAAAHAWAHPPLLDGDIMVNSPSMFKIWEGNSFPDGPLRCNEVFIKPASTVDRGYRTPFTTVPVEIQLLLPINGECRLASPEEVAALDIDLNLMMAFDPNRAPDGSQLQIIRFDEAESFWDDTLDTDVVGNYRDLAGESLGSALNILKISNFVPGVYAIVPIVP